MAVLIGISGWDATVLARMGSVPRWLWTAGAAGSCIVFAVAWLIPRFGAAPTVEVMLVGQLLAGLLLSHYGALGSPVERLNVVRCLGAVIMLAGASLAVLGRIPFIK
jgi:bacterial/archaeal transporter family-2 protein